MKNKKTLKLILLLLIVILAFLTIRNTYSKYVTQADNSSKMNISRWNIKLNDENIIGKDSFSDDILLVYDTNEHIAEGVVVPTSKGYFNLELDSTGTELPFEYEISIGSKKPYSFTLNNLSTNDDATLYLYDISISITNENSDLSPWELSFELPTNLVADSCTLTDVDNYIIENNKLTITSDTTFTNNETKNLNMILATESEINFEINNVTLNNTNFDLLTDRISDFRITSYTLNGTEIIVPSSETSIVGTVIPPDDITADMIQNFTFAVEWYDGMDNVLDNFEDVEMTKNSIPATIPITLKVTQIQNIPQTP